MNFLAPEFLLALLLAPLAIAFYVLAQRRRSRYAIRFTNLDLLANLAPRRPGVRRHVPAALYLAAIAGLLVALARPTFVVPVPRQDATVILAIDVSGSMNALDVEPTRLGAARAAAESFLDQLPKGIRVGLVSFTTDAFTLVEPTTDRARMRSALARLTARGGTSMADAIDRINEIARAVQAGDAGATGSPDPSPSADPGSVSAAPGTPDPSADPSPSARAPGDPSLVAAILLSDGFNSDGESTPFAAAAEAASLNVPIYTIALGTADGQVQVQDQRGRLVTLDVPPDTVTLAQIAETTGAIAYDASTATDLQAVYDNLQSRVGFVPEEQEVTVVLAAAALAFVVLGAGLAALWFGRLP